MEIEAEGTQQEDEKNFHVLAVDDSFIDRKLLERLLKVSSYQVTCVESVDKALEFLGLSDIDDKYEAVDDDSSQHKGVKVNLIMTDYCMPGMSGYDLLKRVKGSSWKDVPVVVMSSENVPSRVSMCLEGGAEKFLLKPVQLSDVKKLQPYMKKQKSLADHDSDSDNLCQCLCHKHDNNDDEESNNYTTQNINGDCKNNSLISKRKAVTPDPPEKRPKNEPTDFALVV